MMSLTALPNQERDETTVLFLRRYWIDLFGAFIFVVALVAVPTIAVLVFNFVGINLAAQPFWGPFAAILLVAYLLVVLVLAIDQVTDYFLDVWIVTTERIINIEQRGLFNRTVSELRLNQIQDVTSETRGFLETFLTYGDVHIQTAGQRPQFHFKNIDNPDDVKVKITELAAACKRRHGDASNPHASSL